jgi:hypothetical protein
MRSKRVPPPLEVRTITLTEGRGHMLPAPELQTGACIRRVLLEAKQGWHNGQSVS